MDSESKLNFSTGHYLFPHINGKGWPIVTTAAIIVAGILFVLWWFATLTFYITLIPFLLLVYGVALFFRDPERVCPKDERAVVSPADGMVSCIKQVEPPEELGLAGRKPVWRVSVFMSVLDVHVNRMPFGGTIVKKAYVPGKFLNASLDKASKDNERQLYLMKTTDGKEIAFVQIAGLVARRIVSFVEEGASLERGQRFGLIRFGSRLDVYLPDGVVPEVSEGQIMVAGESVLARI